MAALSNTGIATMSSPAWLRVWDTKE